MNNDLTEFYIYQGTRLNEISLLFIILIIGTIITLFLSFKYKCDTFTSSIYVGLFISFIQIILTVFLIEKLLDRYQSNQWEKTRTILTQMVRSELKEDLTDIVYMIDFSDQQLSHNYIKIRIENNLDISAIDVIHAAKQLNGILKMDDFADHVRYRKGNGIFSYQIGILKQFSSKMENDLSDLDRIIGYSQINISSQSFNTIIECRNAYQKMISDCNNYTRFLGVSEITGDLIDYNLKFEIKYKADMYKSILNTIKIISNILTKDDL